MIFDETESNQSQTIEALVPMVDLFAVLAIVFMIYSSEEILETKQANAKIIQDIVQTVEKDNEKNLEMIVAQVEKDSDKKKLEKIVAQIEKDSEKKMQEVVERAKKEARLTMAKTPAKTLEEVQKHQKEKAKALIKKVATLIAVDQGQTEVVYESLVGNIENKNKENLEQQKTKLNQENKQELANVKQQSKIELTKHKTTLDKQQRQELGQAKQAHAKELASVESTLQQEKQQALTKAQKRSKQELAQQKSHLEVQKRKELTQAAAKHAQKLVVAESVLRVQKRQALAEAKQQNKKELAAQQTALEREKEKELREAQKAHAQKLASAKSALQKDKRSALAKAKKQRAKELASQEAAFAREKENELSKAAKAHSQKLASAKSALQSEKNVALAKAKKQRAKELAAQEAALGKEKDRAVSATKQAYSKKLQQQEALTAKAEGELAPHVKALKAKTDIVSELNKNFKDFDSNAVEIDPKTGKVRLHFQESYFVRGSHKLSQHMKTFLKTIIPKYAKSLYENKHAAKQIKSLLISGMTSPVHFGRYIDVNDKSSRTEKARRFNMALSNKRAIALYDFIFDKNEMTDYKYRSRMKSDMNIQALGFNKAQPVPAELVGKKAKCIKYDCKQEQATILQFNLFSE